MLCIRGVTYTESDDRISLNTSGTSANPKKIKAYPGERVEIRASFRMGSVSDWEIEGVYIDGSYSPVGNQNGRINTDQAINFQGSSNIPVDSIEATNRRSPTDQTNAGTCIFGGTSNNVTFENSWVHQCGELPPDNLEHCFYVANATSMLIRTNRITVCANRPVQLYSDTNNALVVGNLIDSDHSNTGIVFNGASSNNTVENNVVRVSAGNKTINVGRQYTRSGNQAKNNCLWPTAADLAGSNVTQTGNIGANPQISGHTVTNATCAAKLPAGSPFRP